ncbi:MAG TPA: hypothetical protein VNC18_15275 [Gemmatimonadaceae bacterium]|nr:hypothetical protein [Gemmatimonadaceae bacterium]
MHRIRLLLAGPQLIVDLIDRLIGKVPDFDIVDKVPVDQGLARRARTLRADVVLAGASDDMPATRIDDVLFELPNLKLLTLAPDWASATLYELRPHATLVPGLSREALVDAIHSAVSVTSSQQRSTTDAP